MQGSGLRVQGAGSKVQGPSFSSSLWRGIGLRGLGVSGFGCGEEGQGYLFSVRCTFSGGGGKG